MITARKVRAARRRKAALKLPVRSTRAPVAIGAMIPARERQLEVIPCEEPAISLATSILILKNADCGMRPNPSPRLKNNKE